MAKATITFEDKQDNQGKEITAISINLEGINIEDKDEIITDELSAAQRTALYVMEMLYQNPDSHDKLDETLDNASKEEELFDDEILEKPACNLDDHECESCQ